MTEQQRKILVGVGGAVALLAVVLLLVALTGGDDSDDDVATGDTSSTSSTTTTTEALEPVTSSTTSSTTTTTAAPPPPPDQPSTPPPPPLSADGAVLQRAPVSTPRTFRERDGCQSLGDRGPWQVECDVIRAKDVDLAWLVAEHRGTGALRAYVFRRLAGDQWVTALAMEDEERIDIAGVVVRTEDVSGDGAPDIVFGFRHHGTGQILELDVVEAPGEVVLHRELDKGTAVVRPAQLEDWSAQFTPDDANCCPSSFLHSVIRVEGGAWRVVQQEQVSPDDQPAGDF